MENNKENKENKEISNNPFDKIDKLENKIDNKLNLNTKDMDLTELEDKINNFKPYFKGLNNNNNNIVEFLSKIMFDKMTSTSKLDSFTDKQKTVQNILAKEQWDKVFGIERERLNRYGEYDIIYSYIPELSACIDSFRDAIISPDSLTNDSLPVILPEEKVSKEASFTFINNIEFLINKYKLKEKQKEIIGNTLKFGDQFVAVLRYEDEFQKLLLAEQSNRIKLPSKFLDPSLRNEEDINFLTESFYTDFLFDDLKKIITEEFNSNPLNKNNKNREINEYYDNVVAEIKDLINDVKILDATHFSNENKKGMGVNSKLLDFSKINLKGCIIKNLDPRYIVKLEIDGICLGYLYAKKQEQLGVKEKDNLMKDFFTSRTNISQDADGKSKEEILFNIVSRGLAKKMDLEFIEDNKEYKDLIYLLLKNEELIKGNIEFVYFNPEEVHHFYVDKDGIYGTSRMAKSLFFAKLYIPSILNEFMQKLTRGRDKRVVYVDVGVDAAVEESIQEVVRDIKSKEIQTDNLKSLTTILRTVGNFEDYYIPLWDGEKSIEFDTIQGIKLTSSSH